MSSCQLDHLDKEKLQDRIDGQYKRSDIREKDEVTLEGRA
jgi:hypothetical protein